MEKSLDYGLKHLLCLDIARGLSALHQAGLVHGDLKAENVLVCSSPSRRYLAKISDFGFSVMVSVSNFPSYNYAFAGYSTWGQRITSLRSTTPLNTPPDAES